ncbi:MAG TPA: ABC transporter substrate-binding protein [Acidimicrobiales bacterium]|nr:ABC transporter substrate-binding protein [Acidimicrobiales bacterium]
MHRSTKVLAGVLALSLLGTACGGDDEDTDARDDGRDGPAIVLGAQDFGESLILSEIYAGALRDAGYRAETTEVGGLRDLLLGAFKSGDVNMAVDYVAAELEFLNGGKGEATSDVDATLEALEPYLDDRGLVAARPADAVDTNAFVVTEETSEQRDISTLSDLAANGADLTLGAPPDCESNGFCIPGLRRVYGVDLSDDFTPLDFGLIPDALDEGAIDVGVVTSTDGRLADPDTGWVLLEDDKGMFAADNVFPVLSRDLVDAYGRDLTDVLDDVSAELTTEDLVRMNKRFDVDRDDAEDIAEDWLGDHGFGG